MDCKVFAIVTCSKSFYILFTKGGVWTVLMQSSYWGYTSLVSILLEKGVDVNYRSTLVRFFSKLLMSRVQLYSCMLLEL